MNHSRDFKDKFIKLLIKNGKKNTAGKIIKEFIYLLNRKKGRDAFIFFYSIICKVKPSVKVLHAASKVNKKIINIVLLSPIQQFNYSLRLLIKEAAKSNYKWPIARCLIVELEKIEVGTSSLLAQKYQMYKSIEKNRNVTSILFFMVTFQQLLRLDSRKIKKKKKKSLHYKKILKKKAYA